MYYNSNKSNNDYYNAYKQEIRELEAYEKQETIQKIIKLSVIILAFILFISGAVYLYKYFYPTIEDSAVQKKTEKILETKEKLPAIIIHESELPKSVQLRESDMQTPEKIRLNATDTIKVATQKTSNINAQDIALIVQIIMSQIDTKKEIPLEEQLVAVEQKKFEHRSLKESNHYNKVILTSNAINQVQNSALMELSNNINSVLNQQENNKFTDNYEQEIKKEVQFRTNEMRVIIVQRGDTLSRIAKKAYGDYDAYPKIFAANPEIIKNPNQIFVGQRLRIPS